MARLILVNGAPGAGKSTLGHALAQDFPGTLALDVDALKHSLGRWEEEPESSGLQARRLALALTGEHLRGGFDVILSQYLARTTFIEQLERVAATHSAGFYEVVLELDADTLAERLAERARHPSRPEHVPNDRLVGPGDAAALVETIAALRRSRPGAVWVDARGSLASTLEVVRSLLATHSDLPGR